MVGAGIVGLSHAWHAHRAGRSVLIVERDERAVGASVRNFGHVCTTAQDGVARELALTTREDWLEITRAAGVPVREDGTVVVARTATEREVLEQFRDARGDGEVRLLTSTEAGRRLGFLPPRLTAAAHFPLDLRLDSPSAIPAILAHLEASGVRVLRRTNVLSIESGRVHTSRGTLRAQSVVLAVGHDVDRFFPDVADDAEVRRCRLRMLEIDPPRAVDVPPAVLTGLSMLRYDGLAAMPAAERLREEVQHLKPELLEHVVNLMCTQRPDGRIVIGDTHHYDVTLTPFEEESVDRLVLTEIARLFGATHLTVRRRWRGVYASSVKQPFLVAEPLPGVTVASVTTGIGMTTAFGLARAVLAGTPPIVARSAA